MGHGLHIHNQLFQETTFDKKVQDIARSLEFKIPEFYRYVYFQAANNKDIQQFQR